MATGTPTFNPPASGGVTIDTTTITGGATTQVLYNAAGVVSSEAAFTYDFTNNMLTVGGTVDTGSFPGAHFQSKDNANQFGGFWADQTSVFGQAGYICTSTGGPTLRLGSASAGAGATFLGFTWGGMDFLKAENGKLLIGTTGANDTVIGSADAARMTVRGDGARVALHVALGIDPTTIGDAAKTITAGEGNIQFATTLTAARACNLPAGSAAGVGYIQLVHSYGANNGANVVSINPNGSDAINGGGAVAQSSAYHVTALQVVDATVGAGKWQILFNHAL